MMIYKGNSSLFSTPSLVNKQLHVPPKPNSWRNPEAQTPQDPHHRDDPNNKVDLTDNIRDLSKEAQSRWYLL